MIAFSIWPVDIHYYGLFYAISFIIWYFYLSFLFKKKNISSNNTQFDNKIFIDDIIFYIIMWVLLWWRLWYVFFYNLSYFVESPWKVFYIREWWMAFAGAFIWVSIAMYLLTKKHKINIFTISDSVLSIAVLWIWLWRIWNYLNQELYWQACNSFFQNNVSFMCNYFWTNTLHFSNQLLESFLEGWLLFIIFQFLIRNKNILKKKWFITITFVLAYSLMRFTLEFIRYHPENYILHFWLSISQYLMIIFFIFWIFLLFFRKKLVSNKSI
jgi:phosphatidylglycerol:prolipoprotein diacylglycerol transferase